MSDEPLVASSTVEEQAPPPEKLTGISVYPGIAYGLCQEPAAKSSACAPPSPPSTSSSAP